MLSIFAAQRVTCCPGRLSVAPRRLRKLDDISFVDHISVDLTYVCDDGEGRLVVEPCDHHSRINRSGTGSDPFGEFLNEMAASAVANSGHELHITTSRNRTDDKEGAAASPPDVCVAWMNGLLRYEPDSIEWSRAGIPKGRLFTIILSPIYRQPWLSSVRIIPSAPVARCSWEERLGPLRDGMVLRPKLLAHLLHRTVVRGYRLDKRMQSLYSEERSSIHEERSDLTASTSKGQGKWLGSRFMRSHSRGGSLTAMMLGMGGAADSSPARAATKSPSKDGPRASRRWLQRRSQH